MTIVLEPYFSVELMHFGNAQGQLSFLLKHSNFPRSILNSVPRLEESGVSALFEGYDALGGRMQTENRKVLNYRS